MNESVGLFASAIGLILVPVCLARLALGRADLAALYRAPGGDGWPRGVQEVDCPRWSLEGRRTRDAMGLADVPARDATVQRIASARSEAAAFDPSAGRSSRSHVVQSRAAVHARVGLAGGGRDP